MGTSLTVHAEAKINGQWTHCNEAMIDPDRSYRLYYKMAGVMEHLQVTKGITPLSSPKGLPKDLSLVTQMCVTRSHQIGCPIDDPSYLSSSEIAALENWWLEKEGKGLPLSFALPVFGSYFWYLGGFTSSTDPDSEMPPEVEDVRWVFWFN